MDIAVEKKKLSNGLIPLITQLFWSKLKISKKVIPFPLILKKNGKMGLQLKKQEKKPLSL